MKKYIIEIQQKRLPKANARLTEAFLHAIEMSWAYYCFLFVFFSFFLNGPRFFHCRLASEKENGVLTKS